MRRHDFAPRLQASSWLSFHGDAGFFALLASKLLIELNAKDLSLHLFDSLNLF